ncbi:MAG: DUF1797 family protein [Lactovum sp.]
MKSHIAIILDRLNRLVDEDNPKATYNFEKEGVILMTISFDPVTQFFLVKYPKQKAVIEYDSVDLLVIDIFELLYEYEQ